MNKVINLKGKRFGKLLVLKRYKKVYPSKWLCKCICGKEKVIASYSLRRKLTSSCGCIRCKHGYHPRGKPSSVYSTWGAMIQRCTNKKNKWFKYYGLRGITVCKRWLKFKNFLKDMGERPNGLTLERKNNNKGYKPSNCCWATRSQQAKNQRRGRRK